MTQKRSLNRRDGGWEVYKSRAGWFVLKYPSNWSIEEEEECVTIYDPKNGVGSLQVSAYRPPIVQDPKEVLIEHLSDNQVCFEREVVAYHNDGKKSVAAHEYNDGLWYKKVWLVSDGPYLFMATYTYNVKNEAKEISTAEAIVDSITQCDIT